MKPIYRTLLLLAMAVVSTTASAQWIRVWKAGESTRFAIEDIARIPYANAGQTFSLGSLSMATSEIDSITIVNPVTISWNGATATVNVPANVEGVTYEVANGNVTITNDNTWSEQEFVLSGTGTGSLTYNGTYKTRFHLNGVNLTSASGAALDIQCGKRIDLILTDGTTNSFTDAAGGTQKAAFNCQGHMEVSGSGSLTIAGKTNHGLRSNEYLYLKKSTGSITITAAAGDGIHCGEFYQQDGGTVSISGTAKDGLQVETDDDSDEELNGQFIMNDGTLTVNLTSEDSKAIRLDAAETNTTIVPEMYLLGGTVTVNVTSAALGSKGIDSDGNMTIGSSSTSPTVNVTVAAKRYEDEEGEKHRATGLKATNAILIAGGTTTVKATGSKSRGVSAASLTATGGKLIIEASGSNAQAFNKDEDTYTQNGGTITVSY